MNKRPRRNRKNAAIRNAVQETEILSKHLVLPMFIQNGVQNISPIKCFFFFLFFFFFFFISFFFFLNKFILIIYFSNARMFKGKYR